MSETINNARNQLGSLKNYKIFISFEITFFCDVPFERVFVILKWKLI